MKNMSRLLLTALVCLAPAGRMLLPVSADVIVDAGACTSIGANAFKDTGLTQLRLSRAGSIKTPPDRFMMVGRGFLFN